MQLHALKFKKTKKAKKRIGRGGKRGTYSGRGTKGQKSRAGRRIRKSERDLILRLPKKRGFRNKPLRSKPLVLNLSELSSNKVKTFLKTEKTVVDKNLLEQAGLIPKGYRGEIKILSGGEVTFAILLQGLKVSKNAKIKIEKAGGKISY
ncbi:MAG: uL15 family ribosomal protein [Candidatus Liptonbacteria bacterium]|nr:uL15 family ribosomal protein [Candidatus Liptonbacteria bacterium]